MYEPVGSVAQKCRRSTAPLHPGAGVIQNPVRACVRRLVLAISWEPQLPSTPQGPLHEAAL